jgi:molecular chaperone GrpE (heat shock protein)
MNDVSKFMDATEKRIVEQNYRKIMSAEAETVSKGDLKEVEKARDLLKIEVTKLRSELKELKQVHKSQAEVMKEKQLRLEGERDVLKEEKRKLEYMLYDMLKASDSLKEKVKKIKSICDD